MAARVSRRGFVVGAGGLAFGAAAVAAGGPFATAAASLAAADVYTQLGERWQEISTAAGKVDLTRPEFVTAFSRLDANVDGMLALVDRTANRTKVFIDAELKQSTNSSVLTTTYLRLRSMAMAWFTPGSRHHASASVLSDILAGLDTANNVLYHAGRTLAQQFDNWWDWEIGASRPLADCLVLLEGPLPAEARNRYASAIQHFVPDPYYMRSGRSVSTGANRVDLCQAALVEGISSRSSARIQRAAECLPAVCRYVNEGDGLYLDGSFIQHGTVPYTGAYGSVLLGGMARLLALLTGSPWHVTDPAVANLLGAVERGWAPVIHDGRMMSFVRGREISRTTTSEQKSGHGAVAAILQLAPAADVAMATQWRSLCRGWLERNTARDPYQEADIARTALFSALLRDTTVTPAPEPDASWVFRNMGRAVHRRAGWAFAISMTCNRVARYESINGENLKGFHTGAGMTYLYDGDATQYSDHFWPTVDPYRLPGTTVDRKPIADAGGQALPTAWWAGGAVLDERYSAVGMTLQGAETNLTGKKSWFCFDEYVVALGAGITSTSGYGVETVLENRNLHTGGVNALTVNGVVWPYQQNTSATWTDARWAHLDGVAGYVFPSARQLSAHRYERTGSYRDIDANGSDTPIKRRYVTLLHDHGANPNGASYAYLVVPKATVDRTAQLATQPGVSFLANNATYHAVRQHATGITMVNFWHWAGGTVANISANRCCSVIVREYDNHLTVCVAEPFRSGETIRLTVTPAQTGYVLSSKDAEVTVLSSGITLVLDVRPGTFGRTFSARFARS